MTRLELDDRNDPPALEASLLEDRRVAQVLRDASAGAGRCVEGGRPVRVAPGSSTPALERGAP